MHLFIRHGRILLAIAVTGVSSAYAQNAGSNDSLPVRAVTLFSSGVAYTLREGEVSGDAILPLTFRTAQINDILKSLVLLDDKGVVQPAVYGAKDPIGRALQSFAVDVSQPRTRADLLNRLRGTSVVVEMGGTPVAGLGTPPKETISGQIVGVESQAGATDESGRSPSPVEILTVLGSAGIQSVRLDAVRSVKLTDERMNREFREALSLLAAGSDDKRRQVQLRFSGEGKRRVRVGYVSEAPLWKISYRLLIGGAEGGGEVGKPYLQGWALVENTSDDDWKGVHLSLISGRPVSFIQDLYQPLYLPRPVVPPDVIASPYPQLAEAAIEREETNSPPPPPPPGSPPSVSRRMAAKDGPGGGSGLGGGGFGAPGPVLADKAEVSSLREEDVRRSVMAQATGMKAGELFQYNIKTPVTLPRQQAAMIPVIAQEIEGDKVSLYNADTGPRFPMSAFRIRNNTPLHLKGGPVTLFDAGIYAGDARMEDIPPDDSRLITYAVDLAVEGERQGPGYGTTELSFAIRRGILITSRKERQETTYMLRNKADKTRLVLIEHPFQPEFKLLQPEKPLERTPEHYRFAVNVAPGKSEKLIVVTERPVSEEVALLSADLNVLDAYVARREISATLKAALQEVAQRRRKLLDLQSRIAGTEAEIAAIDKDQERIRKNMAALDRVSALYKRYTAELDQQETRIQALRSESSRLRTVATDADRDLRAYLDGLEVKP